MERFRNAQDKYTPVHDRDLHRWAVEANKKLPMPLANFKASPSYIFYLKQSNRIVSRKINKFVKKGHLRDMEQVMREGAAFVEHIRPKITEFGPENTYNADQSGFNLELRFGRTLAQKGVKKVEVIAQSLSALTHSYTIMPVMSAAGKLLSPLFILLKEPNGCFPQKGVFNVSYPVL